MNKYCTLFVFLIIFINSGAACWFQENEGRWYCSSLDEVQQEANETWDSLVVLHSLHLKKDNFKNAPNLVRLELLNTTSIEKGTFDGLNKLINLRFFYMTMAEIPSVFLENVPIKQLYIRLSKFRNIEPGLFKKLPNIEEVEISNNNISEIHRGVFENTNIKLLSVRNNNIDKIHDKAFANMSKLVELSLSGNMLNEFNSELYIGSNNALKILWLVQNKLTKITKDMFPNIPGLTKLDCSDNQIETVDFDSFENLPKLESVSFLNNNIKEVQKGLFDNSNIRELFLVDNKIEKIEPKAFGNMTKLTLLKLFGNSLNYFNSELYFGTCDSLTHLILGNNSFTEITRDMFSTFPNLQQLDIQLNQIETIQSGSFNKLQNLQYLDISNNKIRSIEPYIFPKSGMTDLIKLTVHNNKLTYINKAIFSRTPSLKYVTYAGNPFQCPCHLELKKYISKRNITRICDQDYLEGQRPVCVFSSVEPDECLYDENLTDDLYEVYVQAVKDYPKLELYCNTLRGYTNASLNQFEK